MKKIVVCLTLAGVALFGLAVTPGGAASAQRGAAGAVGEGAVGRVEADVTDVLGRPLKSRVELHSKQGEGAPLVLMAPEGKGFMEAPVGEYMALVYIYAEGAPYLGEKRDVVVKAGETAYVLVSQLEGAAEEAPIWTFDQDFDLAIDRVELAMGTDPRNPNDTPGAERVDRSYEVLATGPGWLKGELHVSSVYGGGKESVAGLIKRAKRLGYDFLAVTDRNTMAACEDKAFKTRELVMIPAMEWGNDERGYALIYAPGTFPPPPESIGHAQAVCRLVQAQGGVFAVAHPCLRESPWQWGLSYVNAIEAWYGVWRGLPPLTVDRLLEDVRERREGTYIHSVAMAASIPEYSGNRQAAYFYDVETVRGLKAGVIGGAGAAERMGSPVTFVYAQEKSLWGVIDGLQAQRTYVTRSVKGPYLSFNADMQNDGDFEIPIGGFVPLGVPTKFQVAVKNAKGMKLQLLRNGRQMNSYRIGTNDWCAFRVDETPEFYAVYRVRVVAEPSGKGYGSLDVVAMSSPIYALAVIPIDPEKGPEATWIRIENKAVDFTPPPGDPDAYMFQPPRIGR